MTDFIPDQDFYFEGGLMVMTASYLLKRGYCCGSGCRHCPYDPKHQAGTTKVGALAEQTATKCEEVENPKE